VERVAREAILMNKDAKYKDDESFCTALAIRCGGRHSQRDEFAIMVGIGPISPSLHRDVELFYQQQQLSSSDNTANHNKDDDNEQQLTTTTKKMPFYKPLLIPKQQETSISSAILPISILSPTLITATGGISSIDSSILLRRSIEVALSIYKLDNGGIDFFASHSLEGMTTSTLSSTEATTITKSGGNGDTAQKMIMSARGGGGGTSGVKIETLVRRIADMAQSSTQNLGGRYGRMLSSSLLAMGVQQQQQQQERVEQDNSNDDKLCIWRVDPTGQFWKCEASAVGLGTMEVEAELLGRVRLWKKEEEAIQQQSRRSMVDEDTTISSSADDDDDEMNQVISITNEDVRSYLSSLTEDEAVRVASDCLVNGIMKCKGAAAPSSHHLVATTAAAAAAATSSFQVGDDNNNNNNEKRTGQQGGRHPSLRDWMEYDLRRRMECVILRSCGGSSSSNKLLSSKSYEIVRR